MSEDEQVKEVPRIIVTKRVLTGAKAEQASVEECLMIQELAAYTPSIPAFLVNTKLAIGKQEAAYNMSCVEKSLCQQLFTLINKTHAQLPEGDKHLSRRVKRRSWWGSNSKMATLN